MSYPTIVSLITTPAGDISCHIKIVPTFSRLCEKLKIDVSLNKHTADTLDGRYIEKYKKFRQKATRLNYIFKHNMKVLAKANNFQTSDHLTTIK